MNRSIKHTKETLVCFFYVENSFSSFYTYLKGADFFERKPFFIYTYTVLRAEVSLLRFSVMGELRE